MRRSHHRLIVLALFALAGAALSACVPPPPDTSPSAIASTTYPQAPAPANSTSYSSAATPAPAAVIALRIRGDGVNALDLTLADLKAMPHRALVVRPSGKDDKPVSYSGVTMEDLLTKAGVKFGHDLRGPRMREYLLAEASDGYAVVFAMQEIATEFSDRLVIVADAADGKPLTGNEGPLKIIVSDEKKHARWVRGVATLTVQVSAPDKPAAPATPTSR